MITASLRLSSVAEVFGFGNMFGVFADSIEITPRLDTLREYREIYRKIRRAFGPERVGSRACDVQRGGFIFLLFLN